ncbi:hypothetical protein J7T55_007914 [Diaporthe amygdali]|uniref:uncharacterized protein n=1 Tax=Phomopsis amygdali TaxID=1214568 RepID=UPI0022FE7C99|nr:uncharacterized protein J7T55_007914 [Diaporthe amygdali]KAJ0114080.1 hypothetical protein J7T55_007914 [Diaporthe amygdali]
MTGKSHAPPVSISIWAEQVDQDPSIPSEYKNGAQDQLNLSSTSLSSGSEVDGTDSIHFKTVWHKYRRIESLGNLMTDDPVSGYTGYVSNENNDKASCIFSSKKSMCQPYLDELRLLEAQNCMISKAKVTQESPFDGMAVRRQPLRPSRNCGSFHSALHWQSLVTATARMAPTSDELRRTPSITKLGYDMLESYAPSAVNQPIVPNTPKPQPSQQDTPKRTAYSTPEVKSYRLAKGGKSNRPSADETYVNTALLLLLQSIIMMVGEEFSKLDWLATRLPLKLLEQVTTINTDTEEVDTKLLELMEARVDGYLCQRPSSSEGSLNSDPLAICEAKPFTRSSALTAIRRQEGAEMACWISQAGDSETGLLRTSTSGRKRRLMINQDRHEISVVVAEYGAGFEKHIRPHRSVRQGTAKTRPKAGRLDSSVTTNSTQTLSSLADPVPHGGRRDPSLLAGSPGYISRVEKKTILVDGPKGASQDARPTPPLNKSSRTKKKWTPDVGDFLIMHEFGPFVTTDPGHMEVLIKRIIALMLQLRGPQEPFVPVPPSPRFLLQPDRLVARTPDVTTRRNNRLRKSRSWPARTNQSEQDWEKLSVKPTWD